MQAIEEVRLNTNEALDRIINTAEKSVGLAGETVQTLKEQGVKIQQVHKDMTKMQDTLQDTKQKLKYGFGWRGWFMSRLAFRKPKQKVIASMVHRSRESPYIAKVIVHADGNDAKLDAINRLVDDMQYAANALSHEINAQSEDLQVVETEVADLKDSTEEQNRFIRRKFNL